MVLVELPEAGRIIDDLTSRTGLAGAASVLAVDGLMVVWWWWTGRVQRRRDAVPVRILVTGTRGKSSTVRALHAALLAAGMRPCAKTTGTAAAELDQDGRETRTRRLGRPSVLEVLRSMDRALAAPTPPDALVVECMAVRPELIDLVAHRMVAPGIVVLTNAQVDHLEDEGSDVAAIAASMALAVTPGSLVVTGETAPGPRRAIADAVTTAGGTLVVATPDEVDPDLLGRLPLVHPANVATVLAVTRSLGIDDEVAVQGMAAATLEPGEGERWRQRLGSLTATYADLGAVNDPASLGEALEAFAWPPPEVPRIALAVGRWDRPLRSLAFVGCLRRDRFDGVVLTGGPVRQVRRELLRDGWPAERIVVATPFDRVASIWRHRTARLVQRIDASAAEVLVVALQNEHEPLADRVRSTFRQGIALRGPATATATGHRPADTEVAA
jgi:poly-gamma-glutamate synthase PgsB/CapB